MEDREIIELFFQRSERAILEFFADYTEKLRYYEENVLASEVLYAELPTHVDATISDLVICETLIYSKDFDADLKDLREKTRTSVTKVLKAVNL